MRPTQKKSTRRTEKLSLKPCFYVAWGDTRASLSLTDASLEPLRHADSELSVEAPLRGDNVA